MSKIKKTFADIRRGGENAPSGTHKGMVDAFEAFRGSDFADKFENYLSSILLDVTASTALEDMLEDRGRKKLARELLEIITKGQ